MPGRVIALLTLVAWGTLMFGAVYPWAYVPLFLGCAVFASWHLARRERGARGETWIATSLAVVIVAVAIQLIPLPVHVLRTLTPSTHNLLSGYIVGYPESTPTHAISIQPPLTVTALGAVFVLSLFLLGLLRAIDRNDLVLLIRGLAIIGSALTLIAVAQKGMSADRIYGLWSPLEPASPFGPFVNRNHFAGWMLMAMPLALGYLIARVTQGMRYVKGDWRSRLVWFSSPEASETILIAFGVLLMALGLTISMSRSGTLGLIAALAIAAWFVIRRRTTSVSRRGILTTYFVFVMVAAIGWAGVDRLAARFGTDNPLTLGNRTVVWNDTLDIARDFPLFGTGLNTYGVSTLFYQTVMPEKHLAQAHNDYLQLLAEGGLLVCLPAGLAAMTMARVIRERFRQLSRESTDYWIRIGAVTGIVAIALQELADFSLQMPGNAVLFVVLLAIAARPVTPSTILRS